MASVSQSRVRSGFDVEALLGERYLQMLMGTALDAGIIPSEAVFADTTIVIGMVPAEFRLYEATPDEGDNPSPTNPDAFRTEILFDHPLGANVRVRAMIGEKEQATNIDFDLSVKIDLAVPPVP